MSRVQLEIRNDTNADQPWLCPKGSEWYSHEFCCVLGQFLESGLRMRFLILFLTLFCAAGGGFREVYAMQSDDRDKNILGPIWMP